TIYSSTSCSPPVSDFAGCTSHFSFCCKDFLQCLQQQSKSVDRWACQDKCARVGARKFQVSMYCKSQHHLYPRLRECQYPICPRLTFLRGMVRAHEFLYILLSLQDTACQDKES